MKSISHVCASECQRVPELRPLTTSLSTAWVITFTPMLHRVCCIDHLFARHPSILIYAGSLPWAPDSYILNFHSWVNQPSNLTCWKVNTWYFPPNLLFPQCSLSQELTTVFLVAQKKTTSLLWLSSSICNLSARSYWLYFQHASWIWILLTISTAMYFLSGLLPQHLTGISASTPFPPIVFFVCFLLR